MRTLLCRDCNSRFGKLRDRWLGDYILLSRRNPRSPLDFRNDRADFEIDGLRLGGSFGTSDNGVFELDLHQWRTSPQVWTELMSRRGQTVWMDDPDFEQKTSLSFTLPAPQVFEHMAAVRLGFLTAAYLLWFRALGYSWALQKHLDDLRAEIAAENGADLSVRACGLMPERVSQPVTAFGSIDGELALFAMMEDCLVVLPPADRPHFYDELPGKSLDGAKVKVLRETMFGPAPFVGPLAVMYGRRQVVVPDVFFKGNYPLVYIPENRGQAQVLAPVHAEQFDKTQGPGLSLAIEVEIPEKETGR